MAETLLAPTKAKANLLAENLQGRIHVVGNTVIDALKWVAQRWKR
jgi:UDP-N-acetylglucosamine 2-epimerase